MPEPSNLGVVARSVWGKSRRDDDAWLPLYVHLSDSAAVAGHIWDTWIPSAARRRIAACLPGGDDDGRILVSWLAGIHDVGKATPAFAVQVPALADRMHDNGLSWSTARVATDRKYGPHATAGQVIVQTWLSRRGWTPDESETFAVVVGGHHGVPPSTLDLAELTTRPWLLGWYGDSEVLWRETQAELLAWSAKRTRADDRLAAWRGVVLPQPVQALLTAIVIVADWIASNDRFFPYESAHVSTSARVARAFADLDLPAPWAPVENDLDPNELVIDRFELPPDATAHPVQVAAIDLAREMEKPGLLIIEAPMGDGKTEAALAAAEVLAAKFGCGGCVVALPTRATSDAMLTRFKYWVGRLPDADADRGCYDLSLAHGKARWNREYQEMLSGRYSGIGVDGDGADLAAHFWLTGRKKAMLSSFVVGTIDQLLMVALQTRHVVLRHFALAGKVVVIDEAHAYDVYMSRYLDRALEWLGAYEVPVIVLSATLPAARRRQMAQAYDKGATGPGKRVNRRRGEKSSVEDRYARLGGDIGYPALVVATPGNAPIITETKSSGRAVEVHTERFGDDLGDLADRLRTELSTGGCALVVRNTVTRVQEAADVLRDLLPEIPVTVAHSRYMAPDRADKDAFLRETFGPPRKCPQRPERHIVVASQVAEQSLDIDFDLLVTDLAPIDLLLQRMGRLHRHERERPERLRTARCLITGADWSAAPPIPVRGSVQVYGKYPLLRSAAVLNERLDLAPIQLPGDIATLVQDAYGEKQLGPAYWQLALAEAHRELLAKLVEKRKRADTFKLRAPETPGASLVGWFAAGINDTEADARGEATALAQVRDTEDTLEVLLLIAKDGGLYTPHWLERGRRDLHVPLESAPTADVAKIAAECTISLPYGIPIDRAIEELEARRDYTAWQKHNPQDSHWLAGQLVLDFDANGRAKVAGVDLRYDPEEGLRIVRSSPR